ncbi:MAG: O-antigen ligase family protein [Bacteroidales bacterium]|nr:O-antigen ligase family protein [Bacteroidales bacterium]
MSRRKLLSFLIAILPVANIYAFPILINNLGHAILLFMVFPIALIEYCQKRNKTTKDLRRYLNLSIYILLVSLFVPIAGGYSSDMRALVQFVEYTIILFFVISNVNSSNYIFRYYLILSELFSYLLIFQLLLIPFGIRLSGFIPFLDFYVTGTEFMSISEGRLLRASSVFTEPSHFALYVAPALAISLWGVNNKSSLRRCIILTTALLLSRSGNGMILLVAIYGFYIIHRYFSKASFVKYLVGGVIVAAALVIIPRTSYFESMTYGLFVKESNTTESRADARVYRGFALFSQMDLRDMVTGIGWRNAESYFSAKKSAAYNFFYIENFEYFNSIAGILIYSGIIGLLLFFWWLLILWRENVFWGYKMLIVVIVVPMFSSSVFMMEQWPLYIFLLYSTKQYAKNIFAEEVM